MLVGLLTIALVVWEATQIFAVKLELPFKGALLTAGLAAGVLLFTIIKFLVDNEFRHWPAWIGLILAIVIAGGGYLRYAGDEPTEVNLTKAPPERRRRQSRRPRSRRSQLNGSRRLSGASIRFRASSRKKSPQTVAQSSPWPIGCR